MSEDLASAQAQAESPKADSPTDAEIVDMVKHGYGMFCRFPHGYLPLQRCHIAQAWGHKVVFQEPRKKIPQKNDRKRAAHDRLHEIWNAFPAVYFICALFMSFDTLADVKSFTYLAAIREWWETISHSLPLSLIHTMDYYSYLLPSEEVRSPVHAVPISSTELFTLLGSLLHQDDLCIMCPLDAPPLPHARVGIGNHSIKIEFSHGVASKIIQYVNARTSLSTESLYISTLGQDEAGEEKFE